MSSSTIWKFDLAIEDQRIPMPCDARILMRGTRHPIGDAWRGTFIGTVLLAGDGLVLHVFEAKT